jgi:hypothetical protein
MDDAWMNGWVCEWMDGWANGLRDGQTDTDKGMNTHMHLC